MPTQIITTEQKEKLRLLPFGKKHPVAVLIEQLEIGQHLRISREDFKWKNKTPGLLCQREAKKTGKRFEILKEVANTGWVVTRVG